jgi:hypothetical protein
MPSLHTGSPSSNAWRVSSVPIPSNKEEEEANVPPTHPQNKGSKSGTDDDEVIDDLPAYECPAAHLAHCTALDTSVSPLLSFDALIAQGLSSVYDNDAVLELTDAFEHTFHAAALKVTSPSGATEPKSFWEAMAGPDVNVCGCANNFGVQEVFMWSQTCTNPVVLLLESSPGYGLRDLGWQHTHSLKHDPSKNINTRQPVGWHPTSQLPVKWQMHCNWSWISGIGANPSARTGVARRV